MINIKSQKGSVTLFVLIAVLFFSIILFGVYKSNMNDLRDQESSISEIRKSYNKNANEVYEQTVEKLNAE